MAHAKINLQRMFDWIEQSLAMGGYAPDDAAICERFGFTSTESARTLLAELADAGRITIMGYGEKRVISLGRARRAAPIAAPRPVPAVRKSDPEVDAAAAKIMAILGRGLAAPAARPAASPPAAASPSSARSEAMPTQPDVRNITIQARGDLRAAIEQRAEADGVALGRAAQDLVEAGLRAAAMPLPAPVTAEWDGTKASTDVFFANLPDHWLIDELSRRMNAGVGDDDYTAALQQRDAAITRAEAAEGQLATLRAQISSLLTAA